MALGPFLCRLINQWRIENMARIMPNPVWVRKSAVSPRNYNASKRSNADIQRSYATRARSVGKTLGDILAECKYERDLYAMLRSKTK